MSFKPVTMRLVLDTQVVSFYPKTAIEKLENGRYGIVITEFPYRRNKSKILQTISEMTGDKKHQKASDAVPLI